MLRSLFLFGVGSLAVAAIAHAQEPGISETLARDRASRVSNVRYELSFSIPRDKTSTIVGHEVVGFRLTDASRSLALDFDPGSTGRVRALTVGTERIQPAEVNGHLVLPPSSLRAGDNRVTIDFDAGDAPLNRNDDFLYTIFVPARAHEAFPCFDQPDLKARWTLVARRAGRLGNARRTARRLQRSRERPAHLTSASETQPLPTYLFAFAAGKFSVERAERNGRTFRMFHRETDAAKVARNRDAIFDLHAARSTGWSSYTGIPYPFGKFDFVLVPAFQFGGMEHAGAIFYNASGLLLDAVGDAEPVARAAPASSRTRRRTCGSAIS